MLATFSACEADDKIVFVTGTTTEPESELNKENGHEWVDLGLSVKWATCNVGASSPEDYGDYFAWGEITPKTTYSSSNYSYSDNPTILPLSDDAARANWGGSWRMPTYAEMTELCEQCTWTWTSQNGVNGYRVMSKSNGNSIFFPAAGYRYGSSLSGACSCGYFWSSSLGTGYPNGAWSVYFNSSSVSRYDYSRYYGQSVRPVLGEYVAETNIPVVVTSAITQITETSAVAGGTVTSDGGASVIERGVVYSTNPNPVITNLSNTIRPCGSGTGEFTYNITDLQPNTTYYLRAYAKNDVGTAYGEEVSFTTLSLNGYACVDLGLSVKWATLNIGASSPEDNGSYFAWGEVEPKSEYNWSTYKWCNGSSSTITKYNTNSSYDKITLELTDDAAAVNWGGSWRMPTDAEMTELLNKCTWTWTTRNGVNGCKVISKTNGNSIFLPAAGFYSEKSLFNVDAGYYWSSSLSVFNFYADYLYFDSSGDEDMGNFYRYEGRPVRPVCP